jgi:menaquinone-specific isochorismate synthase
MRRPVGAGVPRPRGCSAPPAPLYSTIAVHSGAPPSEPRALDPSLRIPEPDRHLRDPGSVAFIWETSEGERIAAWGVAAEWRWDGPRSIERAREEIPSLLAEVRTEEDSALAPIAVGVFPFSDDGAAPALFFVPERLWMRDRDRVWREGTFRSPPRAEARHVPSPEPGRSGEEAPRPAALTREAWREAVRATLRRIEGGALEKAVLARAEDITADRPYDAARVFETLRREQPGSFRFFFLDGAGGAFLGASPERLVRLRDGEVISDSIAGTIRRGATPREDENLRVELLASEKDRREHDAVVRAVRATLAEWSDAVECGADPEILTLRHVHHLRTPVRARPHANAHVLDFVRRLHPTPAVAGTPRDAALEWIRACEPTPRGWYAGPVGWIGATGEGDFAVGLRSATLAGRRARLYAGAGIVAGSEPDAEWRETELKMKSMRDVLEGD